LAFCFSRALPQQLHPQRAAPPPPQKQGSIPPRSVSLAGRRLSVTSSSSVLTLLRARAWTPLPAQQADVRAAPPPPPPSSRSRTPEPVKPASSRLQGPPPSVPSLDRSASHREPPREAPRKPLDRAASQRQPPKPPAPQGALSLQKSQSQSGSRGDRYGGPQSSSSSGGAVSRHPSKGSQQQQSSGTATPRRREKQKDNGDVVARLKMICTDADPTKLYRNLVKIGQG
jgi:p21-activated kinase 1